MIKTAKPKPKTNLNPKCEIYIKIANSDIEIPLEQYIVGVISAEIYPSFDNQAIRAQAVAARTYALYNTDYGKNAIEPSTAHQVFMDEAKRREKWQQSFAQYEQKMLEAVEDTKGEVLLYNGELITAMFHAASSGQTESAKNYSGNDIPYLQSVVSSEVEKSDVFYSYDQLNERLQVRWSPAQYKAIVLETNSSGRVAYVEGHGKRWTGREIRELLQLKSTAFQWVFTDKGVSINVSGYGHGVGMSQQGANVLAKQGKNYEEILKHYYKGVQLHKIDADACLK